MLNSQLAECLALEAESSNSPTLGRALRKAARAAFLWPVEASDLLRQERSLTELPAIGPYLEKTLKRWMEQGPPTATKAQPETRRDFLTFTEAQAALATRPGWKNSYKGDLQLHTRASDGSGTIREMAEAARQLGYQYIGVTDHSKGLKIAGGIDEQTLQRQGEEIDALNDDFRAGGQSFHVFKSVELNLNPSGQGDMETSFLAQLDLIVGSFHSSLRKADDQTVRYLAALENPFVDILGHPRGRIYNYRMGLKADWKRVFGRAAELGVAVEIDAYPDRQDLNVELLRLAKEAGCGIAIDTDAHHTWQFEFIDLGLAAAVRAGIDTRNILNFHSAEEIRKMNRRNV